MLFMVQLGSEFSDSIYSDVNSLSGNDEDVDMTDIGSEPLLDSAATTFKVKSMFTSEESMEKTTSLAREKGINVNSDLKKQEIYSDWAIVIKKILMNMPKEMIIATVFEFGDIKLIKIQLIGMWQKAVDSVHVAIAIKDQDTWRSKDHFRTLLFTLPVGTTAHNLGTFLKGAGEKTCMINHSLNTDNWTHCIIIGFESENKLEFVFRTKPIFGDVRLSWTRLDLVWCEKCEKFGHSALKYDAFNTLVSASSKKIFKKNASDVNCLQLARLYVKKNVFISRFAAFGGKSWAQIVSSVSFSDGLQFDSGSGSFSSGASGLGGGFPLVLTNNTSLDACLASLECFLEFLDDQVSGIVYKLSSIELVSLVSPPFSGYLVALIIVNLDLNSDMVLNGSMEVPAPSSVVLALGFSSSKILMTKVGCLESKLVVLEALIGSVLVKLD
ncbi:hypothetical protein G9A89_015728 [Geosiphon pyriformis]|nr:hypothetical protein G9A89_015728 [Geosiphon pyriformis]